jgi:hypothetical protein
MKIEFDKIKSDKTAQKEDCRLIVLLILSGTAPK